MNIVLLWKICKNFWSCNVEISDCTINKPQLKYILGIFLHGRKSIYGFWQAHFQTNPKNES